MRSAEPARMPGAISPGTLTLAGASMASLGRLVPSGSRCSSEAALAVDVAPARLAVQAPDSSASGTSAVAFCHVIRRLFDIGPSPQCRAALCGCGP